MPGRAIPPSATSKSDAGTIEKVLLQDRRLVVLALFSLSALAWTYLVVMARQMAVGDMTLMGMGAMTMSQMPWSLLTFLLMFIMWSVMMVGMMVPSVAPMVLLFARVNGANLPIRHQRPALQPLLPVIFSSGLRSASLQPGCNGL